MNKVEYMKRSHLNTRASFVLLLLVFSMQSLFVNNLRAEVPDLMLEDLQGKMHNISDFIGHGKWTLINIWSPTCVQCRIEMPDLNRFHLEHKDNDATVLGVTIDYPSFKYGKKDLAEAFIKKYNITFPILMGDQELASQISGKHLKAIPTTYFFHPDGHLATRWPGMVKKEELEEFIKIYQPETNDWFE